MAEETIQDIFDKMSKEDLDFHAIVIGAAINDETVDDQDLVKRYDNLPDINKHLIDFVVGNTIAEKSVKHGEIDIDDFLSHYGVKGMKWGVRRYDQSDSLSRSSSNTAQNRAAARASVRGSTKTTAKEKHLAGLKSTGHRAINALSGDKTFWKRMAITTGITVATAAVPIIGAYALPSAVLSAIGGTSLASSVVGSSLVPYLTTVEMGQWVLAATGVYGAMGTAAGGTAVNVVGNVGRAVAGNALIDKSYANVGKTVTNRQKSGRRKVTKALRVAAGIDDRTLMQSDIHSPSEADAGSTIEHKTRTIQDIVDEMTPEQREIMDVVVGAAVENEVIEDDDIVAKALALPEEQRQVIDFVVGGYLATQQNSELKQKDDMVDDFLAHHGVKGMKWGVRRDLPGSGNVSRSKQTQGRSSGAGKTKSPKPPSLVGVASTVKLSGSTKNTEDERKAARKAVRKGTATATDVHVAALKSTGHRVANAFLGDKTYWKGLAATAGIAGAVGLSPFVLPAGIVGSIGALVVGAPLGSSASVVAGGAILQGSAYVGAQVAGTVLGVTNLVRAVRGNSRIDDSYARLGANVAADYKMGMDRTAKILRKDGGLSGRKTKKALRQSDDLRVNNFLEHYTTVSFSSTISAV